MISPVLRLRLCVAVALLTVSTTNNGAIARPTRQATSSPQVSESPDLRAQIKQWSKSISAAGKLFKKKQFQQSAGLIRVVESELSTRLATQLDGVDARQLRLVRGVYKKLAKAHQLLTDQGLKLETLAPFPDSKTLKKPGAANGANQVEPVSFIKQVAPIIVGKCGDCHVLRRLGGFSAASFTALDNSAMVTFGRPDQSRFIEIIESGEMPKGNRTVEAAELNLLKTWIAQGAKFDGRDPTENLNTNGSTNAKAGNVQSTAPQGNETVSFGLDVAPILLENCAQCHIARNPRGNFSMANFASILKGGNGGVAVSPGNSAGSGIIARLKGQNVDVMPPSGMIDNEKIATIEKWIEEGARFLPADTELPLKAVAEKGFAQSLGHEKLIEVRKDASRRLWRLAFADIPASETATKNFFLMGGGSTSALEDVGATAESLAKQIAKTLKSPAGSTFSKGNASLFVVTRRYDFAEFGKMVEKRQFDKALTSSWKADASETYVVMLTSGGFGSGQSKAADANNTDGNIALAKDLAAIHVSGWNPTIPRWFADGMAYWTAAKMFRRDSRLAGLDDRANAAANSMKNPDDFVTGGMSADRAALVAYQFVKNLQTKSKAFKKLTKSLRQGESFEAAFNDAYAVSLETLLGQKMKIKY